MKFKTIIIVFLLCLAGASVSSCKSSKLPTSDAEVQKQLYKDKKKKNRAAKKLKKEEYKRFWSLQTKEARKSIRKNNRKQKKRARKMKR